MVDVGFQQDTLDELKLVVGDSFENVASLQGCHSQQRDSVQTLGKSRWPTFPRKTVLADGKQHSLFVRVNCEQAATSAPPRQVTLPFSQGSTRSSSPTKCLS